MGWFKISAHTAAQSQQASSQEDLKTTTQHIETVIALIPSPSFPHQPVAAPNETLPYICPAEIARHTSKANGGLWIVVDNIVYDCTEFALEHPGGEGVIHSFGGQECSWQFWRFHGKREMEHFGKELRIGRTEGLRNRFKEPVRWVGLMSRSMDEW
jgi:cytochrome b involved in lipid metabolism